MLKIYNTLTRRKETFRPINQGEVKMYVCGMTVYDYCHLGHARVLVVFDMVKRWLNACGYKVTYVRNITDIDDKIIARAANNRETTEELTARFISEMHKDADALGVARPDYEPKATEHIAQMISMISILERKGSAYRGKNGDVYFSVNSFPKYGALSGKSIDELRAGERVDVEVHKRDPIDFVLWKKAKSGEPNWCSPWGEGRPGWHIECSAMGRKYLGDAFDIHGGGQDLEFPHHENEIAQTEVVQGHPHVNYWMHNGFVRVNDDKMSKSKGNIFTIRELLGLYDAEVLRFFILRGHYRSPLNYGIDNLQDAKQSLDRLYTALKGKTEPSNDSIDWSNEYSLNFSRAMNDDFNTAEAISVLFDLASEINRTGSEKLMALLKALGALIGFLGRSTSDYYHSGSQGVSFDKQTIDELVRNRDEARDRKDFETADEIREKLSSLGIILEDSEGETTWRIK